MSSGSNLYDNLITIKILKKLIMPFDETSAFACGFIDKDGKLLISKSKARSEISSIDRLAFSLKRLLNKLGGENKIKNLVAAYFLIEDNQYNNLSDDEITVIFNKQFEFIDEETVSTMGIILEDLGAVSTNSVSNNGVNLNKDNKLGTLTRKKNHKLKKLVSFKEYLIYNKSNKLIK